jgi:hypothetical protein
VNLSNTRPSWMGHFFTGKDLEMVSLPARVEPEFQILVSVHLECLIIVGSPVHRARLYDNRKKQHVLDLAWIGRKQRGYRPVGKYMPQPQALRSSVCLS